MSTCLSPISILLQRHIWILNHKAARMMLGWVCELRSPCELLTDAFFISPCTHRTLLLVGKQSYSMRFTLQHTLKKINLGQVSQISNPHTYTLIYEDCFFYKKAVPLTRKLTGTTIMLFRGSWYPLCSLCLRIFTFFCSEKYVGPKHKVKTWRNKELWIQNINLISTLDSRLCLQAGSALGIQVSHRKQICIPEYSVSVGGYNKHRLTEYKRKHWKTGNLLFKLPVNLLKSVFCWLKNWWYGLRIQF